MSLGASEVQRLVDAGAPVLCVDTCSILDVMRNPTRENLKSTDLEAARSLIELMEANGPLGCLLAEQVQRELNDNAKAVETEARNSIKHVKKSVEKVHSIASVLVPTAPLDLRHLDRHVDLARILVDRWVAAATMVPQKPGIGDRAIAR
ncbi:hypothetical protein C3E98_041445, partial [Pseudomonas sp. MWU13-2625]